jgi:phage gpG-like protein
VAVNMRLRFLGEEQIDRTLARFADNVDDARPAWEALADRFGKAEARQFRSEGAYGSGGWAPLSPRYAAWKQQHYPGRPILERTGRLKRDLTVRPFGIEVIEPGFMVLGSALPYGEWHQAGGPNLPRRRPVELPESERREWVRVLQRFIVTGEVR